MNVLVVGGSGLVGTNVVRRCESRGHEVCGTYRSEPTETASEQLDKTDRAAVQALVARLDPDLVVDTAAFHAVDDCETERERAIDVNVVGTRNVASAADAADAHLVYFSTDYVFPGRPEDTPYRESDPVAPCNYYGRTKYAGEQAAMIADRHTVLRTSVVYGRRSDNFVTWALGELEQGNPVDIVDDQVSTPTYAPDLARASLAVATENATGLYHATGPESLSRYAFTEHLARAFDYDPSLVSPISTAEFGQEAPRPADGSLDSTPLYEALGFEFRGPDEAFRAMQE